ncbi:hypothetical protein [Comamonas sp. JC664]|uniref:hypothetical protein n=1 Tax=Comamonas sp. JC664 TaxID=2801917 RepID=UPI00191FC6CA|nr:hypothetical protein [Comamonas sp. JC664]MBL0697486.1 hypothetical protein [Comamonas sp. JC664]GHG67992.1 hypothetical protein GCM10012319_10740 [Comamonas sp. KCTC 72670]
MLSSLVLAATLAAAPAPRTAASAQTLVHVPKVDALTGLAAFMERAGQHAALLRPAAWRSELHPFLVIDPTRPQSLSELGLDPSGPATVSMREDGRVSCMRVSDAKVFQEKAAAAITAAGGTDAKPTTRQGVTTLHVERDMGGSMGYALKGKEVCAFGAIERGGAALLKESVRLVGKTPAPDARLGKLPGVAYVVSGTTVVGLDGTANGLQAEGVTTKLRLPAFQAKGTSPYAAAKLDGLLFSRASVSPAGVTDTVDTMRSVLQALCTACPKDSLHSMAKAVAKQLTGNLLVNMDHVQVRGSLRSMTTRFFAVRQAVAAEVKDAAAVRSALAPLSQLPDVKVLQDGWLLPLKGGNVLVRLQGKHLVVGNEETVTQATVAALTDASAKQERAVEFAVDPKKVARGLSQISLSDILSDELMAALFAASSELGPLLARSERITGWMDSAPGGGHRVSMNWVLPAP